MWPPRGMLSSPPVDKLAHLSRLTLLEERELFYLARNSIQVNRTGYLFPFVHCETHRLVKKTILVPKKHFSFHVQGAR